MSYERSVVPLKYVHVMKDKHTVSTLGVLFETEDALKQASSVCVEKGVSFVQLQAIPLFLMLRKTGGIDFDSLCMEGWPHDGIKEWVALIDP